MAENEQSVAWVVAAVMVFIAAMGWAFMAAGYAHGEEGWRGDRNSAMGGHVFGRRSGRVALADFFVNAVLQIPNGFSVISFTWTHRLWLPITIGVLEVLALIGGYKMKQLEEVLNAPPSRRRSR